MKLRTKFALILLVVTLVLSGVVLGSVELFKDRTIAQERDAVNETANRTAEQVNVVVRDRKDELALYAQREVRNTSASEAVLTDFVNGSRFFAVQVIAPNGTILEFQGDIQDEQRRAAIGRDVGDRTYVRRALAGDVYVSAVEQVGDTGRHIVTISAPIGLDAEVGSEETPADGGDVEGVFAGAIYLDVGRFFAPTRTVDTSTQSVAVTTTVEGERRTLLGADESLATELAATATVEETGWQVRVSRDRTALTDRLQVLGFLQVASLLLVVGSVAGLGYWDYTTNLRQTERLLDAFRTLQTGDYDVALSMESAQEWRAIGEGFNEMRATLERREAAIREREQRLGVLNRVLRHNVRNEMSVVHNYAEIIRDFTDDGQIETAATSILDAEGALTGLSDKARQIDNAFEDADRRLRFDAADLVDDAIESVATEYPAVAFERQVPEDVAVVGIPALEDAVENLLENACEHNDADDPVVEVTVELDDAAGADLDTPPAIELDDGSGPEDEGTEAEDDTPTDPIEAATETSLVCLSVADNGPGIPDHEYEVLTKGEETALEHGSGLGLWLVFWVVDRSGGTLSFDENEPRGTVVTAELPAVDDPDEA